MSINLFFFSLSLYNICEVMSMASIFSIQNLTFSYDDTLQFDNFNLEIEEGKITSIIGPNKSGKTTLTKLICAILPTTDKCLLKGISLNRENVLNYLTKIGIVFNDTNQFITKKVKDELAYPLLNLNYKEHKINQKIDEITCFFEIHNILNKRIDDLTYSEKKKLLIILSLLHDPSLLILDDAFLGMDDDTKIFMLKKLKELNEKGLTILNITSQLDTIYDSHLVYVLNHFRLEKTGSVCEILEQDSYLNQCGFIIPFVIETSLKLKFYGLLDKIYFDIKSLEDDLWK